MLSVMNRQGLQRQIERIKGEIAGLGPLRPGSLYTRHSVCGKPGCRCARAKDPVKHGPYHYLSYTFQGKSHTEFVRQGQLARVQREIRTYGKLMELVGRLVTCHIELARWPEEES
jgi:hypothetical protein